MTNEQWERLQPLLPPQKPKTGRPANDHRTVVNGILWVRKDGRTLAGPTRAVWQVAHGVQSLSALAQVWRVGPHLECCAVLGRPGRRTGLADSLRRRDDCACSSACSRGKKSSPENEALGRSRGGFSTRSTFVLKAGGKLITFDC